MDISKRTSLIRQKALELGFGQCGIAQAGFLEKEAQHLEQWLQKGYHGKMYYMENHFDKRLDPSKLVDGAKTVISLTYNYFPENDLDQEEQFKIAKYAYGEDYHFVVKRKLKELIHYIEEEIGQVEGRAFVDSAPVMERAWAQKSGLGWIGKHSLLISKQKGSFFFLAELIIDMELAYDNPFPTDHCGSCTRCIDACPTDAIVDNQVIDANKCISFLTIELKDEIPTHFKGQFEDWIFGCDICQDVCPWNRFSVPHQEEHFLPHPQLEHMRKEDWEEITEEVFRDLFKKSAVKRTKISGLKRNIEFAGK